MNKFEVLSLFPTPVYINVCDIDLASSLTVLENCELSSVSEDWQKEYGLRSEDTYILDKEECKPLRDWILANVNTFANKILGYQTPTFALTQSWVTLKSPGERHTAHRHPNSIISGVFYWQDGYVEPIIFHRQEVSGMHSALKMTVDPGISQFEYTWDSYTVQPRKNTLVLFPSHLKHSVNPVKGNSVRKCLAFNAMPTGKIGNRGGLDELDFSRLI